MVGSPFLLSLHNKKTASFHNSEASHTDAGTGQPQSTGTTAANLCMWTALAGVLCLLLLVPQLWHGAGRRTHYTTVRVTSTVPAASLDKSITVSLRSTTDASVLSDTERGHRVGPRGREGNKSTAGDVTGGNLTHVSQVTPTTCQHKNTTCRVQACKRLRGKPRLIPLQQLGFPLHMNTPEPQLIGFSDVFVDRLNSGKLSSLSGLLPPSPKALIGRKRFKSCAIVGSSGNLLAAEYGEEIDAHSVVFRINRAPTAAYSRHTGNKTHFRLLNAKWTANYASGRSLPLEPRVVLVASRGAQLSKNFGTLSRLLRRTRPDVQVTLLQHSALYRAGLFLSTFLRCAQNGGKVFSGGTVPSSGLVLIFNLKDVCGQTSVYGFGRDKVDGRKPAYQYFSGGRTRGNPTHNFAAELDLIHAMARNDYIRFCNGAVCVGSGTNKG